MALHLSLLVCKRKVALAQRSGWLFITRRCSPGERQRHESSFWAGKEEGKLKHSEQHTACPMTLKNQMKVSLPGMLGFLQLLALLLGVLFLSVAALSPILAPPGHSHEIYGTKKYARWARGVPSPLCPKRYPTTSTHNFHFQSAYLYPPWDSVSDTQGLASITSQEAEEIPWLP